MIKEFKFFSNKYCRVVDGIDIPNFLTREDAIWIYVIGYKDAESNVPLDNLFYGRLDMFDKSHYKLGWDTYKAWYDENFNVM